MSIESDFEDIPSPIDLRDLAQAQAWVEDTVARRPARPRFFDAFAAVLNAHFKRSFSVLELGSGPGHLAKIILSRCDVRSYSAVDFSEAMHALAREHLGDAAKKVSFVTCDFRESWANALGPVDVVLMMQAAHEVRHKSRQPALFKQVHQSLSHGGTFLFCDHYWEKDSTKHSDPFLQRDEQPQKLVAAGFNEVTLIRDEGGMALYSSKKSGFAMGPRST